MVFSWIVIDPHTSILECICRHPLCQLTFFISYILFQTDGLPPKALTGCIVISAVSWSKACYCTLSQLYCHVTLHIIMQMFKISILPSAGQTLCAFSLFLAQYLSCTTHFESVSSVASAVWMNFWHVRNFWSAVSGFRTVAAEPPIDYIEIRQSAFFFLPCECAKWQTCENVMATRYWRLMAPAQQVSITNAGY